MAGPRDVVVRPAQPGVELEELHRAVARVVLEVEVRIADPPQLRQQPRRLGDHLAVDAGENGCRDAQLAGGVLLDEGLPPGREPHVGVAVAVAREDPHARVVAGDPVLQDQLVAVPGRVDARHQLLQLGLGGHLVHLGLALEAHAMPRRRCGRLEDQRERAGCLNLVPVIAPQVDDGGRRRADPGLLGHLVERVLAGGPLQHLDADVGHPEPGAHPISDGDDLLHEGVRGREQQHRNGDVRERRPREGAHKGVLVEQVGAVDLLHDGGVVRDPGVAAGDDERPHPITLVEGPSQRIGADVATKDDGDELGSGPAAGFSDSCKHGPTPPRADLPAVAAAG